MKDLLLLLKPLRKRNKLVLDKKVIVGLGSGRCGTVSLQMLLNQHNADITHEYRQMPWKVDRDALQRNLNAFDKRYQPIVGDVSFWWLNYADEVRRQCNAKFVCLKRDRKDTIESYLYRFRTEDYWVKKDLYESYPVFEGTSKAKALSIYYDLYYLIARKQSENKDFRVYDMDSLLNKEETQRELFDWLELENHKTQPGIKFNSKETCDYFRAIA